MGPAKEAAKTAFLRTFWVRIIRWRPSLALAREPDLATALGLTHLGAVVGPLGREVRGLHPETLVPGPGDVPFGNSIKWSKPVLTLGRIQRPQWEQDPLSVQGP